jgi:osmotically-inducible protein OsmY
MKNTSVKAIQPLKVLALILCIGALPLVSGITGCTTGSREKQSTGEYIDDHTLTSRVKSALGDDHQYKYGDVNVVTFKGVVQLSGFVNTSDQKSRVGDIARKVKGVNDVQNNVTIKE